MKDLPTNFGESVQGWLGEQLKGLGLTSCEVEEIGGELQGKEQKTAKTKLCYVKSDWFARVVWKLFQELACLGAFLLYILLCSYHQVDQYIVLRNLPYSP